MNMSEFNQLVNPIPRPIRTFTIGFNYLEEWLKTENENVPEGIDLTPIFQRERVWEEQTKIKYMENVLRRIVDDSGLTIRFNCPSWRNDRVADSDLADQMVCLDGLQRISCIRDFISGKLKVFGLSFKDLPIRAILREFNLNIKVYDFQYAKEVYQFYLDINQGYCPHTPEQLGFVQGLLDEKLAEEAKKEQ